MSLACSMTSLAQEGIAPLCSHLGWGQFWALEFKKDIKVLENIQRSAGGW